jgi:hypothetical protein
MKSSFPTARHFVGRFDFVVLFKGGTAMSSSNAWRICVAVICVGLITDHVYQQACAPTQPPCISDRIPMNGHGGAKDLPASFGCNCQGDNRRVISVSIGSSWDVDPQGNSTPGNTNVNVWNATACAISAWNDAQDNYGNKTGYYLVIDQSGQLGSTSDVTIKNKHSSQRRICEFNE